MEMSHPIIQSIKKLFYTYRNGLLADTLKGYGDPHKTIFGLDLPQISNIAREYKPDMALAEALWKDQEVRESRLLAPYLFPIEEIDEEKALQIAGDVRTREEADILSFKLLKRLSGCNRMLESLRQLSEQDTPDSRAYNLVYTSLLPHLR